ncbi:unnamed protein product, partial [Ectocarpus sp. 12 AP-2014]
RVVPWGGGCSPPARGSHHTTWVFVTHQNYSKQVGITSHRSTHFTGDRNKSWWLSAAFPPQDIPAPEAVLRTAKKRPGATTKLRTTCASGVARSLNKIFGTFLHR